MAIFFVINDSAYSKVSNDYLKSQDFSFRLLVGIVINI